MSDEYGFKSSLSRLMDLYVEDFEARALKTKKIKYVLRSLDRYLYETGYDKDYMTKEAYIGWSETMISQSRITIYENKLMVIGFCRYLSLVGKDSYQPPRPQYARCEHRPHVFSEAEINNIFVAVDSWRGRSFPRNSLCMIMPPLLRVLYSTGIRIGEALKIKNKDIDYKRRIIFIRDTKNGKDRIAPINESLEKVLIQYQSYRNRIPVSGIESPDSFLFVSLNGEPCNVKSVERQFDKLLNEMGFDGKPRLHDFRHTACVHSMRKLMLMGYDIYNVLPKLSAYMGHTDVSSTEYYVRLTNQMYPEIFEAEIQYKKEINEIVNRAAFYNEEL